MLSKCMKDEKVSIIVPVYNSEKYLDKCINSILKQTYKNIEIIAINDGSTDGSYEKLKSYAKRDGRIRVFNQDNKGLIETRIKGVQQARGKWIGFVDSDDWIEPNMFEKLYIYMQKNTIVISYHLALCMTLKMEENLKKYLMYMTKNCI